jgi:hypothetical protein
MWSSGWKEGGPMPRKGYTEERFEAFDTIDVLELIASGVCFGVALALVFRLFRISEFK